MDVAATASSISASSRKQTKRTPPAASVLFAVARAIATASALLQLLLSELQATADEGEKKKLARENEALRAQIQRMKIAAQNLERSRTDEKLINGLRKKVCDYGADLEKTEGELAKARAKLAKNTEERASFVQQLKEKYDKRVMGLKIKLNTHEKEMDKQAKNFKAEREHCYALMSQLEEDLQQLQEQNHMVTQGSSCLSTQNSLAFCGAVQSPG
ncbi:uncharacterized protein [Nicotiana sylvestris]|uniref:uncharacterized protein n=1 Tax=Nicotiana sylvestris TaxID=4096 RepID=UPI00388C642F